MDKIIRVLVASELFEDFEYLKGRLALAHNRNYEVEWAHYEGDLDKRIKEFNPRILFLDANFGGKKNWIEVLKYVSITYREAVDVIIMDSDRGGRTKPIIDALSWSADAYLDKPLGGDNNKFLLRAIEEILERTPEENAHMEKVLKKRAS